MPRVIPAHPVYGHPSEERVVDLLRDQLADDCLVVAVSYTHLTLPTILLV